MLVLQDQEWLSVWEKVAHTHIVRLMNNRQKKSKKNDDKSAVALLKKEIGKNEDLLPTNVTIDLGNLMRGVIKSWDKSRLNVSHLMHGNWVAFFRT